MKSISKVLATILISTSFSYANNVDIELNNVKIETFVKMVSKILGKNILITEGITGTINFVNQEKIKDEELYDLLISILDSKDLTMVQKNGYYEIIKSNEVSNNSDISYDTEDKNKLYHTELIKINNVSVDDLVIQSRNVLSKRGKVVGIKDKNYITVSDYGENIENVKGLIKLLDVDKRKDFEIVKINNIKAKKIYDNLVLTEFKISEGTDINNKVNVFLNESSNSIILVGYKDKMKTFKQLIKELDVQEKGIEEISEVVFLKNSDAASVEKILTKVISNSEEKDKLNKVETKITIDEDLNSIVMIGLRENINKFKSIIDMIDIPRQQVYVVAKIIEIEKNAVDKFGLKYGLEAASLSDTGLISLGTTLTGNAISTSILPIEMDSTYKKGFALGISLDMLKRNGIAEVLSEPQILCINNKESEVKSVETISMLQNSLSSTTGSVTKSYTREDIGITLKVKPRLSNDNKVTLEVTAKLEGLVNNGTESGTPTTTKREIKTTSILQDGEPVIIGGLTKNTTSNSDTGVPILSDVPVLGNLFNSKDNTGSNSNLVIILTPYIVGKSSDLTSLRDKLNIVENLKAKYNSQMIDFIESKLKTNEINDNKKNDNNEKNKQDLNNILNNNN